LRVVLQLAAIAAANKKRAACVKVFVIILVGFTFKVQPLAKKS
jgi:hypothetical protein